MKAIVKKTFKDKVTKKICAAGTEIEVSNARFKEINTKGDLLEKVDKTENADKSESKSKKK